MDNQSGQAPSPQPPAPGQQGSEAFSPPPWKVSGRYLPQEERETQVSAPPGEKPTTPEGPRPPIITILAILVFLFGLYQLLPYEVLTVIFVILARTMSAGMENPVSGLLVRHFPFLGIPILLCVFGPVFLIYSSLKMFDGSRKSWLLGLLAIIGTPILNTICIFFSTVVPLMKTLKFEEAATVLVEEKLVSLLGTILNLVPLLIFVGVLIAARKQFIYPQQPLAKAKKLILVGFILLATVPNYTLVGYQYLGLLDRDFGLKEAQQAVKFHLYRPSLVPKDYLQEVRFVPRQKGLLTETEAVRAIFSPRMSEMMREGDKRVIVLLQEQAPVGFTPELIAEKLEVGKEAIETLSLATAKNAEAFYIQKSIIQELFFVTPDNVLVGVISPSMTDRRYLLKIAGSLK